MSFIRNKLNHLATNRRGVLSIEYAVIGVVVVIAAATAFSAINWDSAISTLNDQMSDAGSP